MVSVTGFTSARTQEIEDSVIESAEIVGGHLILTTRDGTPMDAGDVRGGEQIPHTTVAQVSSSGSPSGTTSSSFVNLQVPLSISGFVKYRADTKLICEYAGDIFNDNGLGQYEVAVGISGVYYVVANGFADGGAKAGFVQITGKAAGTYTIGLYRRRVNGAGSVFDGFGSNRNCLKVTETF